MNVTTAQLELTNAELRRRLEEAEDTIRAIRDGEVDALVVRRTQDEEVFTLEGGTESYRAFMEAMDLGAAAFDQSSRLLYANAALCEVLGQSLADLQGHGVFSAFDDESARSVREVIEQANSGKRSVEIALRAGTNERNLLVTASPLDVGLLSGIAATFTDVTERVQAAAVAESERAARAIIASANEAVVVCDRDGRITHVNAAAIAISGGDPVGMQFNTAFPLVLAGATGLVQGEDLAAMAVSGTQIQGVEANAPDAPKVKDLLISAAPLRVAGEKTSGCVITLVDLSQRKAAERQQLLLMAELDHRVKNTLALVLAICARTIKSEESLESFQEAFTGRIQALAATHNLLAEKAWSNLTVGDVVSSELAPYTSAGAGRVAIRDLDFSVSPRAAIALGLVFHELATNAVKHGSLSMPDGRVVVRRTHNDNEYSIQLEWIESGGPTIATPVKSGFGRTVIGRSLHYSAGGGADLKFEPGGVVCTISIPREDTA
jgi:PAS domain S-box-containing protein